MVGFSQAFKLSKSEVANATPPGTVTLITHLERTATHNTHDELRLVPPKSSDPWDPLTWPTWRKGCILACMSILPFIVNFTAASLASALPVYASTPIFGLPPKTFSQLTQLVAINNLMLGASNLWWVPLANTFGRRPVILASLLLLTLTSMWAGLAKTFESLMAARFFMGCGGGPADAVAPDVVGDIFFVHQRGRAMATYSVFLATGSLIGGLCGGYIVGNHGIPWLHWTNVILSAVTLVLCFFFVPETLFDRHAALTRDGIISTPTLDIIEEKDTATRVETTDVSPESYKPFTITRSLGMGMYRPGLAKQFIAPWLTLRLPGVWLVAMWYAGLVGGIITIATVGATTVASPPYLWGSNAGLINVGGLIGTWLGAVYTYLIVDWTVTRKAKRDLHGFTEPEARLPTALPALILATTGMWVFGFVAQHPAPGRWIGLEVGLGMVSFGLMQAPSVGFNYLIESYGLLSGSCFVAVTCTRAIISFAWAFFVGDWSTKAGPAEPFGIFGMLLGIFTLLTIPMWIWGKRLRVATEVWVGQSY